MRDAGYWRAARRPTRKHGLTRNAFAAHREPILQAAYPLSDALTLRDTAGRRGPEDRRIQFSVFAFLQARMTNRDLAGGWVLDRNQQGSGSAM